MAGFERQEQDFLQDLLDGRIRTAGTGFYKRFTRWQD
jgi:hypothetical protein